MVDTVTGRCFLIFEKSVSDHKVLGSGGNLYTNYKGENENYQ